MGRFRIFLISTPGYVDVDLDEKSLTEVRSTLKSEPFLEGYLEEVDVSGSCVPFLIPRNRVNMILEI